MTPTLRQKIERRLRWHAARPCLSAYLFGRAVYETLLRKLLCKPLLRSYCTRIGRGVGIGIFPPFVQGSGQIILGDRVQIYGRLDVAFASCYEWTPVLEVGDRTTLGHDLVVTVGRSVRIGSDCMLATGVTLFDTSSHLTDPAARLAHLQVPPDKVFPLVIGDNVWIGTRAILLPGASIGDGSVVAAGSVVRGPVPPYTVVAGNPAVPVKTLTPPAPAASPPLSQPA